MVLVSSFIRIRIAQYDTICMIPSHIMICDASSWHHVMMDGPTIDPSHHPSIHHIIPWMVVSDVSICTHTISMYHTVYTCTMYIVYMYTCDVYTYILYIWWYNGPTIDPWNSPKKGVFRSIHVIRWDHGMYISISMHHIMYTCTLYIVYMYSCDVILYILLHTIHMMT